MTDFPDSGQLDLFEHSRAVALANDVIDALLARDAALSTERLNGLCIEEPGHSEGLNACRAQLMRLALLAPQRVPALFAEIDEPLLNRDWRAFQADCHWLDSEDDTAGSWYPAWQLVEYPGMEIEIGELATLPATRAGQTFVEIRRVLSLETCGYSAALVSARSRLRELSREVFALYMARRNVRHP